MKTEFTKTQEEVINNCSNTYLRLMYMIDFLFKNNNLTEKWCEILNETTKTNNKKAKIIYLYLEYLINTRGFINKVYKIEFPEWIIRTLEEDKEENEDAEIVVELHKLDLIEAISLKDIILGDKKDIELEQLDFSEKPKVDYNLKHLRKIKVKYDNFKLKKKVERKINYDKY